MTTIDQLRPEDDAQPAATLSRRGLLLGAGSAAAAIVASTGGLLASPSIAGATAVTGLVSGSGHGVANRLAIQAAVDAAPSGATLQFPAGTYDIDVTAAPVWLPRSIALVGALGPTPTVFDLKPADHLTHSFLQVCDGTGAPAYPDVVWEGVFHFSDFTINGPATAYATPYDPDTQGPEGSPMAFGIGWGVRTSNGQFNIERVTMTGALAQGVMRSGLGLTRIIDCHISAYISPVAIWDDTDTAGASGCVIKGGSQSTGTVLGSTTKYSSVGIYIHPCCALAISDVTFERFQRYAVYTNGEPDAPPLAWVVDNIVVDGCGGVVQGANKIHSMFHGIKVRNGQPGPGSPIKGSATFVACDFRGLVGLNLSGNRANEKLRFIDCWIDPENLFAAHGHGYGEGTDGTVQFIGCTMAFHGDGMLISGTGAWKGTIELLDCTLYDCRTVLRQLVYLAGGSLRYDNTTLYSDEPNAILTEPGVPVEGTLNHLPATTCPAPPG